jgi:SAM-dependent methyltransferase
MPTTPTPLERLLALVRSAQTDGSLRRLVLAGPRPTAQGAGQQEEHAVRIDITPIVHKAAPHWRWVHHFATRDVTQIMSVDEGLQKLAALAGVHYANVQVDTTNQDVQFAVSRKGRATLRVGRTGPQPAPPAIITTHNRQKTRWVDLGQGHWQDLGVADENHELVPSMARKWRQINKFVELVAGAITGHVTQAADANEADSGVWPKDKPLHINDFGCGRGYLSFGIYEHLLALGYTQVSVQGVELRGDLVDQCNRIVRERQLDRGGNSLRFVRGDLRNIGADPCDVMIALHACDTATDHALHLGVSAGAGVLVCSPCCHKQLRGQMRTPAMLKPMFKHGVHLAQESEMVTDSLRALLLETQGYDAKVFEFVALEHTSKNKMILATRVRSADAPASRSKWDAVRDIKSFWGVNEHALETLLTTSQTTPCA